MLRIRWLGIPVNDDAYPEAQRVARAFLRPPGRARMAADLPGGGTHPSGRTAEPVSRATYLGSAGALGTLGLNRAGHASAVELGWALQGKHAGTREHVRTVATVGRRRIAGVRPVPGPAAGAASKAPAVVQLVFAIPMPAWTAERLRDASPAHQEQITAALLRSAEQAIAQVVASQPGGWKKVGGRKRDEPTRGFAAVARVDVVREPADRVAPPHERLEVRGVLLGVQRADGKLVMSIQRAMDSAEVRALVEKTVSSALAGEPALHFRGRQADAAVRAFAQPEMATAARRVATLRPDPLERWREQLGDARVQQIGDRADELAHTFDGVDDAVLYARRRALKLKLGAQDRVAARETLSLERDLLKREVSLDQARRDVAALKADDVRLGRRARADMSTAVEAMERRIAAEEAAHAWTSRRDTRLASRRRFDAWMARNTDQVAEAVEIDRQLLARLDRAIEHEVGQLLERPSPRYVRAAIGAAPEPSAPEHGEWVTVASRLVQDHHVAAANRAAGFELVPPDPHARHELDAHIDRLRAQRGMEPRGVGITPERLAAGLGVG